MGRLRWELVPVALERPCSLLGMSAQLCPTRAPSCSHCLNHLDFCFTGLPMSFSPGKIGY